MTTDNQQAKRQAAASESAAWRTYRDSPGAVMALRASFEAGYVAGRAEVEERIAALEKGLEDCAMGLAIFGVGNSELRAAIERARTLLPHSAEGTQT